jgi:hypothetical protein
MNTYSLVFLCAWILHLFNNSADFMDPTIYQEMRSGGMEVEGGSVVAF